MNAALKGLVLVSMICLPLMCSGCREKFGPTEKAGKKIGKARELTK